MTLDELLALTTPPEVLDLSQADLKRFFWKLKGCHKAQERDAAFWAATNENLKSAYEKLDEQERKLSQAYATIQADLGVAHQIQTALLPRPSRRMESDLEIAVHHRQLEQVGGDYYDYFTVDEGRLSSLPPGELPLPVQAGRYAIAVFDISGHGVSAALVMAYLKALFTQGMSEAEEPHLIVNLVNEQCIAFLRKIKRYASVNFVRFLPDRVQYVCGGGFGLILRQGEPHHFTRRDHFLGLRERPFRQYELPFAAGDLMVLHTDGIPEAQDAAGADYGTRRLYRLIGEHANERVEDILARCLDDYQRFRAVDVDDITLIILRRKGSR
ncbi:MAG: SpoIIE family protein phosphatase [Myxococcales bacterium]|nr:SpoIIE family protein phosphatase [Myxococcales bacterium]